VDADIDVKPWEGSENCTSDDGILHNTVVVRNHRSQLARLYDAGDSVLLRGEVVLIEADAGCPSAGTVVRSNRRESLRIRLPRVIRRLQPNEQPPEPRGIRRDLEVFGIARHVASTLTLPVKIVKAQTDQSGKTVVYVACEERTDFRELYRRVSAAAQGRIEIRQVGVRDAAKMLGGIAPCGLRLCCGSFLKDFAPVSIRMAKDQGLVLHPQRVSGLCGRLLCCLTYEDDLYHTQRKNLPKLGKRVLTPSGPGRVRDVDVLSQVLRVTLDSGEIVSLKPSDITVLSPPAPVEGRQERGIEQPDHRAGRSHRGPSRQTDPNDNNVDTPLHDTSAHEPPGERPNPR